MSEFVEGMHKVEDAMGAIIYAHVTKAAPEKVLLLVKPG